MWPTFFIPSVLDADGFVDVMCAQNTVGRTLDVPIPSAAVPGHFMLMVVNSNWNTVADMPTGWTRVFGKAFGGAVGGTYDVNSLPGASLLYRWCDGTEGASVTLSAPSGFHFFDACIYVFRDVDAEYPLDKLGIQTVQCDSTTDRPYVVGPHYQLARDAHRDSILCYFGGGNGTAMTFANDPLGDPLHTKEYVPPTSSNAKFRFAAYAADQSTQPNNLLPYSDGPDLPAHWSQVGGTFSATTDNQRRGGRYSETTFGLGPYHIFQTDAVALEASKVYLLQAFVFVEDESHLRRLGLGYHDGTTLEGVTYSGTYLGSATPTYFARNITAEESGSVAGTVYHIGVWIETTDAVDVRPYIKFLNSAGAATYSGLASKVFWPVFVGLSEVARVGDLALPVRTSGAALTGQPGWNIPGTFPDTALPTDAAMSVSWEVVRDGTLAAATMRDCFLPYLFNYNDPTNMAKSVSASDHTVAVREDRSFLTAICTRPIHKNFTTPKKFYFELQDAINTGGVNDRDRFQVGILSLVANSAAKWAGNVAGALPANQASEDLLYTYISNGDIRHNGTLDATGTTYGGTTSSGEHIGVGVDFTNNEVRFYKGGVQVGTTKTLANPAEYWFAFVSYGKPGQANTFGGTMNLTGPFGGRMPAGYVPYDWRFEVP
jgi:hypothetical protein